MHEIRWSRGAEWRIVIDIIHPRIQLLVILEGLQIQVFRSELQSHCAGESSSEKAYNVCRLILAAYLDTVWLEISPGHRVHITKVDEG